MARWLRVHVVVVEEALEAKLSTIHTRRWWSLEKHEAAPTTPAIKEKMTIKLLVSFPMGKNNGENENPIGMFAYGSCPTKSKQYIQSIWDFRLYAWEYTNNHQKPLTNKK